MKLKVNKELNEDVINVSISVDALGNTTLDEETERNYLNDYNTSFQYSDIDFKANMKLDVDGTPVVTDEVVDDSTIVEVELKNLINKVYRLAEDMVVEISIDTTKIPDSELKAPFTTKGILGQAYAVLFADKIQKTISDKLTELRDKENTFESEIEVIL